MVFGRRNRAVLCLVAALAVPTFLFNNCSKSKSDGGDAALTAPVNAAEEQALMDVLNKAASRSADLASLQSDLQSKESRETDSLKRARWASLRVQAEETAAQLEKIKTKILNMLQVQRLGISSNEVLSQVDFLILALSDARSLQLEIQLRAEIGRVEDEAVARDSALQANIDNLSVEFAAFKADVDKFRAQVNARFDGLEDQVAKTKARLEILNTLISGYKASSVASEAALRVALADLRIYTEKQVVELTEQNSKLKEDILKQKQVLADLFKSQQDVANIAGRLCSTDATGAVNDTRTKCTGSEPNLYNGAICCLTIDAVDCGVLFPRDEQVAAQNQCNILVTTVKNHDEQLKNIREVDEKQTSLISGLLEDVKDLNKQVSILADGYAIMSEAVGQIANRLGEMDERILLLEFKAARSEAAAALNERGDLNLAWIARRTTDVSARFCSAQVQQSLNQFDYEAARQNWHYCKERLEFLTRAKELTQLAKAYTNGVLSVNVDTACTAVINGKQAENLTSAELLDQDTFKAVQDKCKTGGPVVARALMLNIVQLYNVIGPDFRTVQYMAKKAKVGQMLFLGKTVDQTNAAERAAFEMVDPTDARLAKTLYSRVERPFVKRYVENRMRTLAGTFPENPASLPENIAGFNVAYTLKQIKEGTTPFFQRLAVLEVGGVCSDCGFQVEGRTTTDVVVSRAGKERFQYPKDADSLCPVMNDVVVLKHQDGKFYSYTMNYAGMQEEFKPALSGGGQIVMAGSEADVTSGNFASCGRHADYLVNRNGLGIAQLKSRVVMTLTQPYGTTYAGRGACVHTAFHCVMRDREFIAPTGATDLLSYLNGYSNSVVDNKCKYNMGRYSVPRTRMLETYEKSRIRIFNGVTDAASLSLQSKINSATTQLTSDYWTLRTKVLNYGVSNASVSKQNPFFGSVQSHSDRFIRANLALTEDVSVQECTPNDAPL